MNRVNKILKHPVFVQTLIKIDEYERTRKFCKHGIEHLLDVARIASILLYEEVSEFDRELVYAASLLHDTGRAAQYESGSPHDLESAKIAREVLQDCGFTESEICLIESAILAHRNSREFDSPFETALYRADKLSRNCRDCSAVQQCNWPENRKNLKLEY